MRQLLRGDDGPTRIAAGDVFSVAYEEFLTTLAKASAIGTPTRADLARIDRKRKKKGSNDDWTHPQDPDAKITKMKDGRTHLAHKAEHAIDLETGAIVGVTVQDADEGDTATIQETLPEAADQLDAVAAVTDDAVAVIEEVVADKGYHSRTTVHERRPKAGDILERRAASKLLRHRATTAMPTLGADRCGRWSHVGRSSERSIAHFRRVLGHVDRRRLRGGVW